MRPVCSALLALIAYLVVVFIVFRIVDLFSATFWWQPTTIVDPILLSVRRLKQLLETRGVSYTGCVEKKELAELVTASADVVQGEVDELDETSGGGGAAGNGGGSGTTVATIKENCFEGSAHFYEKVRDTKDGVWLVQVVPHSSSSKGGPPQPLLDEYTWRLVTSQVAPFDIKTGIFDCRLDPRLCKRKGWDQPLLLLALPKGTKPKDEVVITTCTLKRPQAIIEWLREELSIRVKKVEDFEDLETNWLGMGSKNGTGPSSSSSGSGGGNAGIKVLLLTHLLHPPLFLAALSIKFTGRMTFGIFSVKKEDSGRLGKVPAYLVVTPEKTVVYGRRKMEHFNLRSMNTFLATIQPETNDVFLFSLLLVNMFAAMYALQGPFESWWRLAVAVWDMVVCNLALFAVWLTALRWFSGGGVGGGLWGSGVVRGVALSWAGSLARCDWVRLLRRPWLLATSLVAFGALVGRRRQPPQTHPPPPEPQPQPRHLMTEERLELVELIEWLSLPNLFLPSGGQHWVRPLDYVDRLTVWRHGRRSITASSTDADDDSSTLRSASDSDSPPPELPLRWSSKCPICLEYYRRGNLLCALPCAHFYHHSCILEWLRRDNHHCPICRWPAYKSKKAC